MEIRPRTLTCFVSQHPLSSGTVRGFHCHSFQYRIQKSEKNIEKRVFKQATVDNTPVGVRWIKLA